MTRGRRRDWQHPSIAFERVTVAAETIDGAVPVIATTTLELTERRIALIGPNGSGKSTLARLINGLVEPSTGQVIVNGIDVAKHGREVRRQVSFAFTDPAAQLVMPTVAEDVALSLRAQYRDADERAAAAEAVLAHYGISELATRSVHTLSGGQRQLVALASVLATDPAILVADEPTTLLDLINAHRMSELLMNLDQMVLVATHDLELAGRCERALLVYDGAIVGDGDPAEVIEQYRERVRSRNGS